MFVCITYVVLTRAENPEVISTSAGSAVPVRNLQTALSTVADFLVWKQMLSIDGS